MSVTIGEMTFGHDQQGANQFKEDIKAIAITDASNKLADYQNILDVLDANWIGNAHDQFVEQFKGSVEEAQNNLKTLSKILDDQFDAIKRQVDEIDNNLMSGL